MSLIYMCTKNCSIVAGMYFRFMKNAIRDSFNNFREIILYLIFLICILSSCNLFNFYFKRDVECV